MQDSATAGVEQLANQIRLEVVQAHQNHISSDERLAVARLTVTQSEEAHRIVQDRYQAGLTTITEVLRAETALVRARTNLVDAQYDQRIAYASVLFATGMLTDERSFAEGGSN
jgi:outer membrane protein TolC